MALSKQEFSAYIKKYQFRELFNDMGWNNDRTKLQITPDNNIYTLQAVAEKSGFKIIVCPPDPDGIIPEYNTRKKIETKVTRLFQEHLIIFTDQKQQEQIWQLAVRQTGKPLKVTETRYNTSQDPELLYQRASGLFFELDEEEKITIVDVTQRVADNFHQNAEKVTKQFYERFKKVHVSFYDFVKGIDDVIDEQNKKLNKDEKIENRSKQWYVSLMLNRLMFCYFIQKKGFLDENKNYLRDKLRDCQQKKGRNKFYSFYRDFLMVLFHEGLNEMHQKDEVKVEIGRIPYLNGGLFDEHELEKMYKDIDIDDKAFESVFDFFDQYEWHLDTRVTATGKDINPDVIGYIFEKYINDRAQMGAYYTKEDITEYISKNTVLPWLFDETKRNYPKAFDPVGEIWQRVKNSSDDYIYNAVKHGIPQDGGLFDDLPDEIKTGFRPDLEQKIVKPDDTQHLWEIRKLWKQKPPSEIALPTEIYREVIERRKRYADVKCKIENGEITQINDFITYNLNIRQFAQDVIENTDDPDLLRHFYKAINKVAILDPTCGSGAFLFAAMNILESLYEACLMRMRAFVEEEDHLNEEEKRTFKNQYKFFRQVLAKTQNEHHPNLQYYIYKSIILQNLYGVDIMKEAVEIAKLRLFLKLVATVDADYRKPNLGLEPLPDIDFNIRAGNTLVGFATEKELGKALVEDLHGSLMKNEIEEKCDIVARTFARYKEIQLSTGDNYHNFKTAKEELNKRLKELNHKLNFLLHKQASKYKYEDWLSSHQPFHWFAEFYEIIHDRSGFDVIIGNPPYLSFSKINYDLQIDEYRSSDLYGYVIRRSFQIINENYRYAFIVMHNLAFSRNFSDVRKTIRNNGNNAWFSFFARIPAGLFSGDVRVRNCIFITEKKENAREKHFYTTRIHRWFTESRNILFDKINYSSFSFANVIPMFNSQVLSKYYENKKGKTLSHYEIRNSKHKLFYKQTAYNWIAVSKESAPCYNSKGKRINQSQVSSISFIDDEYSDFTLLFLNGKAFFSRWLTYGDEFHVTKDDLVSAKVPYDIIIDSDKIILRKLALKLSEGLVDTVQYKMNAGKKVGTYNTSKLWNITDQSDKIFLRYLTDNQEEVFDAIDNHVFQTVITFDENE